MNNLSMVNQNKFRYVILPGNPAAVGAGFDTEMFNTIYDKWKKFWIKMYADAGSPESFLYDDFLRQDLLAILFHENIYVGSLFSSFFNIHLNATVEHRYFKFYSKNYVDHLKKMGIKNIMSVEFLMLDPAWKKSNIGFSVSEVIIALSTKIFQNSHADALVGTARTEVKVNDSCYKLGFFPVEQKVKKRNFEVDLIAATKGSIKSHPDKELGALIRSLWMNRSDYANITTGSQRDLQQVA